MALAPTTQPREREKVRPEIPEAQNPITGDLSEAKLAKLMAILHRQMAQELGMPAETPWGDLRLEEVRQEEVRKFRLRQDASWGRILLTILRRYKTCEIGFPEPGKTFGDDVKEDLRKQRAREFGLREETSWDDIEIARGVAFVRKQLGLPPGASLRDRAFRIQAVEKK